MTASRQGCQNTIEPSYILSSADLASLTGCDFFGLLTGGIASVQPPSKFCQAYGLNLIRYHLECNLELVPIALPYPSHCDASSSIRGK